MNNRAKVLTLVTCVLAYFANCYIYYLPFLLIDKTLTDLSIEPSNFLSANILILIFQNLGILIGALVFGHYADKKGRLLVLFGSVFLYGLATFLGGFTDNFYVFILLRFVVGLGLAPELGIGLVLVCEIFNGIQRSRAIMFIGIFGFFGIFLASGLSSVFYWRDLYLFGGLFSLLIMIFRFGTFESDLFEKIKSENRIKPQSFISSLKRKDFWYLVLCILPVYMLSANSVFISDISIKKFNFDVEKSIIGIFFSLGAISGFILNNLVINKIKSRLRAIQLSLVLLLIVSVITTLVNLPIFTYQLPFFCFILLLFLFGLSTGYLFEFFILTTEYFGTNKRASTSSLIFSLGRSAVLLFTISIQFLDEVFFQDYAKSVFAIEILVLMFAFWASTKLKESYNRDLDFVEYT
jgi:putative MFS transporter